MSLKINDAEHPECLNCGTPIDDDFCPTCGQKRIPKYHNFWELVKQFMGTYISFDSKFTRTLRPVLFRPGFLTTEYRDGKRAAYIPPIRLFVFVSIVFFLILAILPEGDAIDIDLGDRETSVAVVADSTDTSRDSLSVFADPILENEKVDSMQLFDKAYPLYDTYEEYLAYRKTLDEKPGFVADIVLQQAYKIKSGDPEEVVQGLKQRFFSLLPKLMFLVMPLFALILKMLYIRRSYYYEEHFVFALHFHAFIYLSLLILFLLELLIPWAPGLFPIVTPVYLFMALRTVYTQGFWKTLLKIIIITVAYMAVLAVAIGLSAIYTALTF